MTSDNFEYERRKAAVARRLGAGDCGGDYHDAMLVLGSAFSGVAAKLWWGERIDRKRFVELWIRHAPQPATESLISLRSLGRRLEDQSKTAEATAVRALRANLFARGEETRVLAGHEIDLPDTAITSACPALSIGFIRESSYPNLYYRFVRSGLVHEYSLDGQQTTATPMGSMRGEPISYSNEIASGAIIHRIHFDAEWFAAFHEAVVDALNAGGISGPLPIPSVWWLMS